MEVVQDHSHALPRAKRFQSPAIIPNFGDYTDNYVLAQQ
jgi:hypothetical protein